MARDFRFDSLCDDGPDPKEKRTNTYTTQSHETLMNKLHCISKNAPISASRSFDKHGLVLIIFGKRHQHTFRNDMRVQLSLSLHFYLVYLLLNSCDRKDAFWRHSVLVKQFSSFSRKHRTLSVQICVRQTVRLTTEFVDWCRNLCALYKHLSATPAAVTSDLKRRLIDTGKHITKIIDKTVGQWRKRLGASMKAKGHHFEHLLNWNRLFSEPTHYNRLFSEPPTVYPAKHVVSRHIHRSYLKANKLNKVKG